MNSFTVEFFEKPDGTFPAEEFILAQNTKMQAKLYRSLVLLEEWGYELREPYSKMLDDGIFELRVKQGTDISRVLYFFVVDKRIILTNDFMKKTQKTPAKEIALAKKYRALYEQERGLLK